MQLNGRDLGIKIESVSSLAVSALVLGALNSSVRPLLVLLTLPMTLLSLGLFYFVINGFVFGMAAWLVPGFGVSGFGWAFVGAILMGLVSMFVGGFMAKSKNSRS
jgi:putative membrane protein